LGGTARVEYRRRRPPRGGFGYESVTGAEPRRDGKGWVYIRKIIDREKDRYVEHIVDYHTGDVLRDVDEPLSKHLGHGTERRLKK
jgi:hypothetical protein